MPRGTDTKNAAPGIGRERIMERAAALFLENGYADTSLRQIAATCEMKAGSLYYHFNSKEALFAAILERGMDVMVTAFDEAAVGDADSPKDRLERHVLAHLEALYNNGPFTASHVTAFRNAPEGVRTAIVPRRDAYEKQWTRLLRSLLPDRKPREIAMLRLVLFGAMNSSIEWFDAGRGNLDQFARIVTDQFWFGARQQET